MSAEQPARLVALSPGGLSTGDAPRFLRQLQHACDGGLRCLVLREPSWQHGPLLALARSAADVLHAEGGALVLHDTPHLVVAAGAHGVHLGFRSLPPTIVRPNLAPERWIGFSAHASDPIEIPAVDYVFFSPIFATPSKQGLVPAVGLEALAQRVQQSSVPVYALGGIQPSNVHEVWATQPSGVVLRSALWSSARPGAVVARLLETLT